MNSTAQDEITEYVERVRAALADLPEATRAELLEDLPEHLAEIRAEDSMTLTDRLGSPEAYAAELRATAAGFVGGFPDPPKPRFVALHEAKADVLRIWGRADVKIGPLIGYATASEFLTLLRPAWWVLRGYLAAMAIALLLDGGSHSMGLLPRVGNSTIIALLLLAGAVIGSILLGARDPRLTGWQRNLLHGGTAVLAIFALAGFFSADSSVRDPGYQDVGYSGGSPFDNVRDLFVYDQEGRLVPGARLFDQEGNPVQLGDPWCNNPDTGEVSHSRTMGYPFCPDAAPFTSPTAGATPSGSTTPSVAPSAIVPPPTPSTTPSTTPTATKTTSAPPAR
ncbi:HAAS signaling domain-containing protein [Actinoplanes solisilvae]|uniref:HAAS signaling domain-containing protein n=1 Tax=Actinoplanes solisilvae TaxID=2486853 RepID=UPI0013E3D2FD|nr:hypothetical protein [Actinoplanes solisilvae]